MKLFKHPDLDDKWWTVPMNETPYFQWLKQNNPEWQGVRDKRRYLESIGFIQGEHRLGSDTIRMLKYIENYAFRVLITEKGKHL